jgi:hypothetical protein
MLSANPYFTVFGGSYVVERHNDNYRFDIDQRGRRRVATSWLVLCTLIAGISVFAAEIAHFGSMVY